MFIAYPYLLLLVAACLFGGAFVGLYVASVYQVSVYVSEEEEDERG
jgi:hypothetical protein